MKQKDMLMGYVQTAISRCLSELSSICHGNDGGTYYRQNEQKVFLVNLRIRYF